MLSSLKCAVPVCSASLKQTCSHAGSEVYDAASPGYRGRCTAPLLVDRRTRRAVCNESSVIVRNLNAVHLPGCTPVDLFPAAAAAEIEQVNELVYDKARARLRRLSRPY